MPPDPKGGASAYVRDTGCCVSQLSAAAVTTQRIPIPSPAATKQCIITNNNHNKKINQSVVTASNKHTFDCDAHFDEAGISPPPPYTTIYPPSPPSSAPSSPATGPVSTISSAPAAPLSPPASLNAPKTINVLSTVFPESSSVHSMNSKPVDLTSLVSSWKGALLEDNVNDQKTLYVVGGHFDEVNLRDAVCGVLDKAEDELCADAVVFVLEKNQAELGDLLHSLMYVGGTIVNQTQLSPNPAYLLVGLDV